MSFEYEMVYSEGRKDSNGNYTILPGNVFRPVVVDEDEKSYWEKVSASYNQMVDPIDHRIAKASVTWLMGPIAAWLNDNGFKRDDAMLNFPVSSSNMRMLINLIETGVIDFSTAKAKVFPEMVTPIANTIDGITTLDYNTETPFEIMERLNLFITKDDNYLDSVIDEIMAAHPDKVTLYKGGKVGLAGMLMGEVMKKSAGKFDAKTANPRLLEKLNA